MRNRYYDAAMGRFMQRDPIGGNAGDVNWYRYCRNETIHHVDSKGLWSFCVKTTPQFCSGSNDDGHFMIGAGIDKGVGFNSKFLKKWFPFSASLNDTLESGLYVNIAAHAGPVNLNIQGDQSGVSTPVSFDPDNIVSIEGGYNVDVTAIIQNIANSVNDTFEVMYFMNNGATVYDDYMYYNGYGD